MPQKADPQIIITNLQQQINSVQQEKLTQRKNFENRIKMLELEVEELQNNQEISIDKALNKAKNQIKSKGQASEEANKELSKLRRDINLKDH